MAWDEKIIESGCWRCRGVSYVGGVLHVDLYGVYSVLLCLACMNEWNELAEDHSLFKELGASERTCQMSHSLTQNDGYDRGDFIENEIANQRGLRKGLREYAKSWIAEGKSAVVKEVA